MADIFNLKNRVAVITGGAGLLGVKHAEAIASRGGIPVLLDVQLKSALEKADKISKEYDVRTMAVEADITDKSSVEKACEKIMKEFDRVEILINNAANNPKMEAGGKTNFSRFENFPIKQWQDDIGVGLTGAFLCSQVFGQVMSKAGKGVILNIASDLAVIAPDQRIYRKVGVSEDQQPVKPVTYTVVKTALLGLTRYLATYWAESNVRVNAISLGGVRNNQPDDFVKRLSNLIPMGRMAEVDEYKGAILFLCSDASSYMTGQNLVVDGGRTCW